MCVLMCTMDYSPLGSCIDKLLSSKIGRGSSNAILLCLISALVLNSIHLVTADDVYTDQFVVQVPGGPSVAQELAAKHGFTYLGHILQDFYHLRHHKVAKRSISRADEDELQYHNATIQTEPTVRWFFQQTLKRRNKRDFLKLSSPIRSSSSNNNNRLKNQINDPRWPQMWYLNRGHGLDMNVQPVWAKNITGKDVVVTILDDGLEKDHPDLIANYDPQASFDVNNHDEDPMPRYDLIDSNRHGTRCAGEVAANANNNICAVGIAYNAKVGGVRMLDGDVTDAVEARSLSLNPQHIDIYSASWGPDDDGKTVDGPGELATRAFIDGVSKGRNGLGSIFVWASGNGGREHDNCNCDGYTNSIWTLSISSSTENGLVPWYSEACSSTLATTYSSGSFGERQIVTTDLHHGCTSSHTGTSASAPLAAGICALALQANPKLTWRDMQHIVVHSARPANLHARDWKMNGVGRNVSHSFGYGLMDANTMVDVAKEWVSVPSQKVCEVRSHPIDKLVPAKSHVELTLQVACDNVHYLEHVQAKVTLTATRRGDIHIYLTSPSGTRATLLAQRPMDNSRSGFQNWPFMSVHSWGENPNGIWRLEIHNEGRYYISSGLPHSILGRAFLKEWTLVLYGTTENPDRRQNIRSKTSTPSPGVFNSPSASMPVSSIQRESKTPLFTPTKYQHTVSSSPTKASIFPMQTNDIENPVGSNDVPLSDSQRNMHKGWPAHETRADKVEDFDGSVNRGCSLTDQSGLQCLECMIGYFLLNGECMRSCPDGYHVGEITTKNRQVGACNRCHYSCKRCFGANDNQCNECYSDAALHRNGHCHAKELVQEVMSLEKWYSAVTAVFLSLCFVILVLVVYILSDKNPNLLCCISSSSHHHRENLYNGFPLQRARHTNVLNLSSAKNMRDNSFHDDASEDDL